MKAKAQKA